MVTRHHDYNIGHAGTRTYLRRMLITTSDRDKHESTIHSYKTLRGRNPSIDSFQFILRVDTYIVNYFGMLNLVCEMKPQCDRVTTVACLVPCLQASRIPINCTYSDSDELSASEKTIIELESWSVSAIHPGPWPMQPQAICLRMPSSHMKQDHGSLLRLGQRQFLPEFMAVCRSKKRSEMK